ncbi:interferon regulatory factor 4-like [Carassius carassius]|uniref:interferon regulatory factor 4-like n=1 Tax=Carassius carassius TaxID=217509 RepID=UPI002868B809|nr:interferon regulatory factor 4-like [Carassius carassius]XP_059353855.1 interferon regulatory factor 4-like [Carassius carassius]
MSGSTGNGKLRQWLIEQVDTGKYPGLVWEDRERTVFRIPWKHAGKQDYNRDEDAALFKAWALFKGKYREGIDKPDPPTWKTRLRCALNKSSDFEELVGRSQLDVSEPFKVYRVIPEGTKRAPKSYEKVSTSLSHHNYPFYPSYEPMEGQVCNFLCEQNSLSDVHFSQNSRWDTGYQISGSFYSCNTFDSPPSPFSLDASMRSAEAMALSDARLQVMVFSGETLVTDVTVVSAEGCRLAPHDDNWTYSSPELVPLPQVERGALEGGVLLWMMPDGLYARRFCQSRVYCDGTHANLSTKLCKLEREQTSKLLDTQLFLTELQGYFLHARPPPRFHVQLFFECCDPSVDNRPLSVQVEPLFVRQLLLLLQQGGVNYTRSTHELCPLTPEQVYPAHQENPVISGHQTHGNFIQE